MIHKGAVLDVHAERLFDDIALAAELGLHDVRFDVPWAAAQPRAGAFDGDVLERVHGACQRARALGLDPWLRLLQPDVPHWFDDEGGFTDARTAGRWWPRWAEAVSERFGDVAAGWVPFEAPFAMASRLVPDDARRHGELMHQLVVAWRDAWRILRGPLPVASSLDVAVERPADDSPPARLEAGRRDRLRWDLWLRGFADGIVRVPGRADAELADLQGSLDVLGLALRADVETCLFRTAEYELGRPLQVTYRPPGTADGERAQQVRAMWQEAERAAEQVGLRGVTVVPFADRDGVPGIVTRDRELKDSGAAFVGLA